MSSKQFKIKFSLKEFLFSFHGRITRKGYWGLFLSFLSIFIGLTFVWKLVAMAQGSPEYLWQSYGLLGFLFLWPSIAVQVKRWHDINKSGWWTLVNLLPVFGFFVCLIINGWESGTKGDNNFGIDPLNREPPEKKGTINYKIVMIVNKIVVILGLLIVAVEVFARGLTIAHLLLCALFIIFEIRVKKHFVIKKNINKFLTLAINLMLLYSMLYFAVQNVMTQSFVLPTFIEIFVLLILLMTTIKLVPQIEIDVAQLNSEEKFSTEKDAIKKSEGNLGRKNNILRWVFIRIGIVISGIILFVVWQMYKTYKLHKKVNNAAVYQRPVKYEPYYLSNDYNISKEKVSVEEDSNE